MRGEILPAPESDRGASALVDERTESDDDLSRERKLVDATVNEIQHDIHVAPALRRSIRQLRTRLRQQRHDVDDARRDARQATDTALGEELQTATEDRRRAANSLESAEQTLQLDRREAQRGLRSIIAEIDVIAASVHAIRMRTVDMPRGRDVGDLASAIEVAADRVLELAGGMLDPGRGSE